MPFVWQTKFHKVSIKSTINIISFYNLGFGSEFFGVPNLDRNCLRPKQSPTKSVLDRNCPRPKLSHTKTVPHRNCPTPKLSQTETVLDQTCPRPNLSQTKPVPDPNCSRLKLSHIYLSLTQIRSKSGPNNLIEMSKSVLDMLNPN